MSSVSDAIQLALPWEPDEGLKRCSTCRSLKPPTEFHAHRQKGRKAQLRSYCKECGSQAKKRYYAANAEKAKAYSRAHRATDPEAARARDHARYWANPEKRRETSRRWARKNPGRPPTEATRERFRRYYARKWGRRAPKFTLAQLLAKMAYWGNRCWVCGGPGKEVDHVKPLAKGGAHILCNLRPICRSCNAQKADRWPFPLKGA